MQFWCIMIFSNLNLINCLHVTHQVVQEHQLYIYIYVIVESTSISTLHVFLTFKPRDLHLIVDEECALFVKRFSDTPKLFWKRSFHRDSHINAKKTTYLEVTFSPSFPSSLPCYFSKGFSLLSVTTHAFLGSSHALFYNELLWAWVSFKIVIVCSLNKA